MSNINVVMISGNLTRDPELRSTGNGSPVLQFSIASNESRKNQQTGEWEEYPNFVECTLFGKYGETMSQYMTKGSKVCVTGRLRYSTWEKDGQKRSKHEIIVDNLELMQSRQNSEPTYSAPQPVSAAPQQPYTQAANQPVQGNPQPPQAYYTQAQYPPQDFTNGTTPPQSVTAQVQQSLYGNVTQAVQEYTQTATNASVYDEDIPF